MTETGEATHLIEEAALIQPVNTATDWFAVQTKARHEKRVATELKEKGVEAFLPLAIEMHQWSDRKRRVELPLFSTYVFVRLGAEQNSRIKVLQTHGVFSFVGVRGMGSPIPEEQIETLQTIVEKRCPFLRIRFSTLARGSGSAVEAWTVFVGFSQPSITTGA